MDVQDMTTAGALRCAVVAMTSPRGRAWFRVDSASGPRVSVEQWAADLAGRHPDVPVGLVDEDAPHRIAPRPLLDALAVTAAAEDGGPR